MNKDKLLIVGESPLPDSLEAQTRTASILRTWHFLSALRLASYEIILLTIDNEISAPKVNQNHYIYPKKSRLVKDKLKELLRKERVTAVIAVNNYPSFIVSQINPQIPFWADLNGWLMAEGQAQANICQDDAFLPSLWKREKLIIKVADKFSVVSTPQYYALYGELASQGRLNSQTNDYEFAEIIPNATEIFPSDIVDKGDKPLFRGSVVPADAFCIAFIGGYNTWVDEITLFKAVENAISKNPKIYFVSTGGGLKGLNNKTFSRFKNLINNSSYKKHFHFLGWLKVADMAKVYAEADCGINIDFRCPETIFGARNRLNEMLKMGLPVITTVGSEIANEIKARGIGLTAWNGDYKMIRQHILDLSRDRNLLMRYRQQGKKYIKDYCSYHKTCEPLLSWLRSPDKSPRKIVNLDKLSLIKSGLMYFRNNGLKIMIKKFKKLLFLDFS